jgi:1-acyl-sn-glycerol-3-phosphate acyltransferase
LSVCIFPEGGVPDDESLLLDTFKDGAFRLAIEHQIQIVPISFADNKETLLYFFSAWPWLMRVKYTNKLKLWKNRFRQKTYQGRSSGCHLYSASRFENQSKRKNRCLQKK